MFKNLLLGLVISCFLFFISACNNGSVNNNVPEGLTENFMDSVGNPILIVRDGKLAKDIAENSSEIITWLRVGIERGTGTELKTYAKEILAHHEQMDREIRTYASKKNIELENTSAKAVTNLNDSQGKDWDLKWTDAITDKHRGFIKELEGNQKRVQDVELEEMIAKILSRLRSHLQTSEMLKAHLDNRVYK